MFQAQYIRDDILSIATLDDEVRHGAMRGPQRDRQCHTRHSGNVSDIVEGRCRGIGGISLSLDAVALSAFRMGQPASFSDIAELLRACIVIRRADCHCENQH